MIAFDDEPDERRLIEETVREERMTYPCFLDKNLRWLKETSGRTSVPLFLLIGRDGRIRFTFDRKLSEGSADFERLREAIEQALAAPP